MRTRWAYLVPLVVLITACTWPGGRKAAPPPGQIADPIAQLEREKGVPVTRVPIPLLLSGRRIELYRYIGGKAGCGHGVVAFNLNGSVQSHSTISGCMVSKPLEGAFTTRAGDQTVLAGLINSKEIARVEVHFPGSEPLRADLAEGVFYLVLPGTGYPDPMPIYDVLFVGLDKDGNEVFRQTGP